MPSQISEKSKSKPRLSSKLQNYKRRPQEESLNPTPMTGQLVSVLTGGAKLVKSLNSGSHSSGTIGEDTRSPIGFGQLVVHHIDLPTDQGDPVLWSEIQPPGGPSLTRILRTKSAPAFQNIVANIHHWGFKQHRVKPNIRELHIPPPQGGGVLGLLSRQTVGVLGLMSNLLSLVGYRQYARLDEAMLKRFNQEVGIVSSRVDMWRKKLEEESSASYPHSVSPEDPFSTQLYAFIYREIQHLVQLTTQLATTIFGALTWVLSGLEANLFLLLQTGSRIIYPAVDMLIITMWRILEMLVDLWREEDGKNNVVHLAIEAINNAFISVRSLIHLGYTYQAIFGPYEREYNVEDSRTRVDYPAIKNMCNEAN